MTVIQRHGQSKPTNEQLAEYQTGYDTREHIYGSHEGKTLFINDGGEVRDVTEGYLKEEFVNYCIPCDTDGNQSLTDGNTVYQKAEKVSPDFHGILEDFNKSSVEVKDDNGEKMGEKITFGSYIVNTKDKLFTTPEQNSVSVYSFDPIYLQKLKNSLQQKAVVKVDSYAEMLEKAAIMADSEHKSLEEGVQFIVKNDESGGHNNDTSLYVVSNYIGTEELVREDEENPNSPENVITNYDGKTYRIDYLIPLEYLYHDPVAKDFRDVGLTVEVGEKDEEANTVEVGLTDHTEDTIINAFNEAFSKHLEKFGESVEGSADDRNRVSEIKAEAKRNGQRYTNYVYFYNKEYDVHNNYDPLRQTVREVLDFNDFVLDEGSWTAD